jgi:hypothetical protein
LNTGSNPGSKKAGATQVVLVSPDPQRRFLYAAALRSARLRVRTAATFGEAKALLLDIRPGALVSEVRLGDHNGLHLALWAQRQISDLRTVIVGESDPALEIEARASGLFFVPRSDEQSVLQAALEALAREMPRRRWHRKALGAGLRAHFDGYPGVIVDIGYGGFRGQTDRLFAIQAEEDVTVEIRALDVQAQATCRWVTSEDKCSIGASVDEEETKAGSRWRALVDRLATSAG